MSAHGINQHLESLKISMIASQASAWPERRILFSLLMLSDSSKLASNRRLVGYFLAFISMPWELCREIAIDIFRYIPYNHHMPSDTQDKSIQQIIDVQPENVRIAVMVSRRLDRALEVEAARRDVTKGQIVDEALAAFLPQGSAA